MGHPLKKMVRDLGIAPQRLNVSSFDAPALPNRVLRAATAFSTATDQEARVLIAFQGVLLPGTAHVWQC